MMLKKACYVSVLTAFLLQGCGDTTKEKNHPEVLQEPIEKSNIEKEKDILEKVVLKQASTPPLESEKENTTASSTAVRKAKEKSASIIAQALESVETLELEEKQEAHGNPKMLEKSQQESIKVMQRVVAEVEAAKKATKATMATAVKSVETARSARTASSPRPAIDIKEVESRAKSVLATALSNVEIAKAKAAATMASSTAKVEMNRRLYGDASPEFEEIKSRETAYVAQAIGMVEKAKTKAVSKISEAVASVEIAKAESGFVDDHVTHGQNIYLKELKKICGMSGIAFATKHTQSEWEEIRNMESFGHEVERICPNLKKFSHLWENDLYEFAYEYAKGSGNVPSSLAN